MACVARPVIALVLRSKARAALALARSILTMTATPRAIPNVMMANWIGFRSKVRSESMLNAPRPTDHGRVAVPGPHAGRLLGCASRSTGCHFAHGSGGRAKPSSVLRFLHPNFRWVHLPGSGVDHARAHAPTRPAVVPLPRVFQERSPIDPAGQRHPGSHDSFSGSVGAAYD